MTRVFTGASSGGSLFNASPTPRFIGRYSEDRSFTRGGLAPYEDVVGNAPPLLPSINERMIEDTDEDMTEDEGYRLPEFPHIRLDDPNFVELYEEAIRSGAQPSESLPGAYFKESEVDASDHGMVDDSDFEADGQNHAIANRASTSQAVQRNTSHKNGASKRKVTGQPRKRRGEKNCTDMTTRLKQLEKDPWVIRVVGLHAVLCGGCNKVIKLDQRPGTAYYACLWIKHRKGCMAMWAKYGIEALASEWISWPPPRDLYWVLVSGGCKMTPQLEAEYISWKSTVEAAVERDWQKSLVKRNAPSRMVYNGRELTFPPGYDYDRENPTYMVTSHMLL